MAKKAKAVETPSTPQEATPALAFAGQTISYKSVRLPSGKFLCQLADGSTYPNQKAVQTAFPGATVVWVKNPPKVKATA